MQENVFPEVKVLTHTVLPMRSEAWTMPAVAKRKPFACLSSSLSVVQEGFFCASVYGSFVGKCVIVCDYSLGKV